MVQSIKRPSSEQLLNLVVAFGFDRFCQCTKPTYGVLPIIGKRKDLAPRLH
jgi:hypothetical protein